MINENKVCLEQVVEYERDLMSQVITDSEVLDSHLNIVSDSFEKTFPNHNGERVADVKGLIEYVKSVVSDERYQAVIDDTLTSIDVDETVHVDDVNDVIETYVLQYPPFKSTACYYRPLDEIKKTQELMASTISPETKEVRVRTIAAKVFEVLLQSEHIQKVMAGSILRSTNTIMPIEVFTELLKESNRANIDSEFIMGSYLLDERLLIFLGLLTDARLSTTKGPKVISFCNEDGSVIHDRYLIAGNVIYRAFDKWDLTIPHPIGTLMDASYLEGKNYSESIEEITQQLFFKDICLMGVIARMCMKDELIDSVWSLHTYNEFDQVEKDYLETILKAILS